MPASYRVVQFSVVTAICDPLSPRAIPAQKFNPPCAVCKSSSARRVFVQSAVVATTAPHGVTFVRPWGLLCVSEGALHLFFPYQPCAPPRSHVLRYGVCTYYRSCARIGHTQTRSHQQKSHTHTSRALCVDCGISPRKRATVCVCMFVNSADCAFSG